MPNYYYLLTIESSSNLNILNDSIKGKPDNDQEKS